MATWSDSRNGRSEAGKKYPLGGVHPGPGDADAAAVIFPPQVIGLIGEDGHVRAVPGNFIMAAPCIVRLGARRARSVGEHPPG